MNPRRNHNRETLYKFISPHTGLLILRNCKIRWSAPGLFNDPFDVPKTICDGIDDLALHHAVVDAMNRLVENPSLPYPEHHTEMTRELIAMIRIAGADQKRELLAENEKYRSELKAGSNLLEPLRDFWRTEYPHHRILCLSERWNSASMWDRYSDGHKGMVLELTCSDKHDSAWLMAKPVKYCDEPLKLNTATGLAELLFYKQEYAVSRLVEEYTHTKTKDWEPEREWRVASWKRDHEGGLHADYAFLPAELKAVFLGARMEPEDKEAVLTELAKTFPRTEVWQATVEDGREVRRERLK